MTYFIFQTGHGKGLAKQEIEAVLGDVVVEDVYDGFVVETEIEDARLLLDRMGGIVRITEVIQSGPVHMPLNFESWMIHALTDAFKGKSGKFRYGLSIHPKSEKILKKCLIGSKKSLKETLGNLRFINKDFQNLSSVQAWHENLLSSNAMELHLFKSDEHWHLCKTLAIQNFEWYSKRDYDRPATSAKNGMFPPKLAQILINLAQPTKHVFDPFCGSGTVLQESLLLGFSASGSDISSKMIEGARKNLEWLAEVMEKDLNYSIFEADAKRLSAAELPSEDFVIVSETWLGPLLTQFPSPLELPKIQREIEAIYEAFFSNLKSIVKSPTTMVFTAPYHKDKANRYFLPRLPEILAMNTKIVPLSDHERPSSFYERKQQIVGREIWKVVVG